jgi:hypothetical protein
MDSHFWFLRRLARPLSLTLALVLASPVAAQEVSPALLQAAWEAYQQEQHKKAQILSPVQVDPKLVGKKVVVYYLDGRVKKGQLAEVVSGMIRLKVGKSVEEIFLDQVSRVEKQTGKAWRNAMIIGFVGFGAFLIVVVSIALTET